MNRINRLFTEKQGSILSIYFTAGFPLLDSTASVIRALADAGTDMIEIGIPFSDPMADGPVIQQSSDRALKNGMSLSRLFSHLSDIRRDVQIPLLLMGYLNPVMQYGMERFCEDCSRTGIDGVILPDMPIEAFAGNPGLLAQRPVRLMQEERPATKDGSPDTDHGATSIQERFQRHDLHNIFLISPQTSEERIRKIDGLSGGFIYMVSASSTTGVKGEFTAGQKAYFQRVGKMNLVSPRLIGFGISDHDSFMAACEHAQGAIIGSAFVKILAEEGGSARKVTDFIHRIREGSGTI